MNARLMRYSVLFLTVLGVQAFGQTAGMVSFQGLIKDADGFPVNGTVNLEFRIFDAETLGSLVDMDGDGVVEDIIGQDAKEAIGVSATNGILSTKFGPVSPKAFDGNPRWLQVSVGGSPLSRIEMATAPATAEQINAPASGTGVMAIDQNRSVWPGGSEYVASIGDNTAGRGSLGLFDESGTVMVVANSVTPPAMPAGGVVGTFGPNGSSNVELTFPLDNSNVGWLVAADATGAERASMFVASPSGMGKVRTKGPSGNVNCALTTNALDANVGWVMAADATGAERASMFVASPSGEGIVRTSGPNGNVNCALGADPLDANFGWIAVTNATGAERVSMFADSLRGDGTMWTRGPNGNSNVTIGSDASDANRGWVALHDAGGNPRIDLFVNDSPPSGTGIIVTKGASGNDNVVLTVNGADPDLGWMTVDDATGSIKAEMFASTSGEGRMRTRGLNGNNNVALTVNGADPNLGWMTVGDATGSTKAEMYASTSGKGVMQTFGPNGNRNASVTAFTSNLDHGLLLAANANGDSRAEMFVGSTSGAGRVRLMGPNGNQNVALNSLSTNADHGRIAVYDSTGTSKAGMYVDAAGNGIVWGTTKSFRMPHPQQPGKEIWYACPEGPEAAAYFRGTARLIDGAAEVPCPNHFQNVATARGMTVSLTPLSADSLGLAVVRKGIDAISIRELSNGQGNYEFDYYVMAVRRGLEEFEVVRDAASMESIEVESALHEEAAAVAHEEAYDMILDRPAVSNGAAALDVSSQRAAHATSTPRAAGISNAAGAPVDRHAPTRAVRQHAAPDASEVPSEQRDD